MDIPNYDSQSTMGVGQSYVAQIFSKNNILPTPDTELTSLVASCLQHFKTEDFTSFLVNHDRFDGPGYMRDSDKEVEHCGLRKTLKQMPQYMEAAQRAGLTYNQANDVLNHVMEQDPYDFNHPDKNIMLLTRIYDSSANTRNNLPQNIETFKELISVAAKHGVLDSSLYAFVNATELGLSVTQSTRIIRKLPDADGDLCGHVMKHFNKALKSLKFAEVDPNLVAEVFDALGGKRPCYATSDYQTFELGVTFGLPSTGITANQMLSKLATHARKMNGDTQLLEEVTEMTEVGEDGIDPSTYFNATHGKLQHAALPYRVQRSLNDGIRDLEEMATARSENWEEVGEGLFVFSPETQTWYSLGGMLEIEPGKVRTNFIPYDISSISDSPMLFHIHPKEHEVMIAPAEDSLAIPQLRKELTEFLASTPSREDYAMVAGLMEDAQREVHPQSYIVHNLGITQFEVPSDVERIKQMSKDSTDIRDQAMMGFDMSEYDSNRYFFADDFNFVQRLVEEQNGLMPEGFKLTIQRK